MLMSLQIPHTKPHFLSAITNDSLLKKCSWNAVCFIDSCTNWQHLKMKNLKYISRFMEGRLNKKVVKTAFIKFNAQVQMHH